MGCAGLLSWGLGVWWAQNEGYDRLSSNEAGTTKFSDDEGLIAMMEYATDWYSKGYINVDYATKTEDIVLADFISGNCAMICTGNWNFASLVENMGEENLGILAFPDLNENVKYPGMILGGIGQSLCVMEYTKYPQECVDFLSYLNNRENTIRLATHRGMTPGRADITAEELGYTTAFWKKASDMTAASTMWYEFAMTPSMVEVIYTDSVQVITGKMPLHGY